MPNVCTKSYAAPPVDRREILRYAGVRGDARELAPMLDECLAQLQGRLCYKVCYCELPVVRREGDLEIGVIRTASESLRERLAGCERAVLFAATVGLEIDRLIQRYGTQSPAKALFLQAIGTERVEALCDLFEGELSAQLAREGFLTRPRFSPGYGDLALELQRDVFAMLDCPRKIGVFLGESLLMTPSKSVTALIGIKRSE